MNLRFSPILFWNHTIYLYPKLLNQDWIIHVNFMFDQRKYLLIVTHMFYLFKLWC